MITDSRGKTGSVGLTSDYPDYDRVEQIVDRILERDQQGISPYTRVKVVSRDRARDWVYEVLTALSEVS